MLGKKRNISFYHFLSGSIFILLVFIGLRPPIAVNKFESVDVKKTIDGDTIELSTGQQVRFIGIDTPEIGQPWADEATKRTEELLKGHKIRLEYDVLKTDRYDRILAYVWVGDVLINEVLLKEGLARPLFIPPDRKYQSRFSRAVKIAQKNQEPLWKN
jgi:micrococcal nuclease